MCGPACFTDFCVELADGAFIGMGQPQTCMKDADCLTPTDVCFVCPGGAPGYCSVSRCSVDRQCGAASRCDATGRCVPSACTSAADCPPDFACVAGACQRKRCSADAQCHGYCVTGWCYPTLGICGVGCG